MTTDMYRNLPAYPDDYTAGNVLGRLMDGLGFRYYWATDGLAEPDLDFRPSDAGRSLRETLEHVYNVVAMIDHAFTGTAYAMPEKNVDLPLVELRETTLERIGAISERLKASTPEDFGERVARFQVGERTFEFPFWNTINGVMTDAIHHVGQVVSFRRSAGNPMDPAVNVYVGNRLED